MLFEIAMGLLLLHKKRSVKIGRIDTMIFLTGIAPLSLIQILWLGLLIGEFCFLKKEFDRSFLDMLQSRPRPRQV